jgi:hypothetical protein
MTSRSHSLTFGRCIKDDEHRHATGTSLNPSRFDSPSASVSRPRNSIHGGVFPPKTLTPARQGTTQPTVSNLDWRAAPKASVSDSKATMRKVRSHLSCSGLSTLGPLERRPSPLHPGTSLRPHAWRSLRWARRSSMGQEAFGGTPQTRRDHRSQVKQGQSCTQWLGFTSRHSGSTWAAASTAWGQRVRNRHPDGGLTGLGRSPWRTIRSRSIS